MTACSALISTNICIPINIPADLYVMFHVDLVSVAPTKAGLSKPKKSAYKMQSLLLNKGPSVATSAPISTHVVTVCALSNTRIHFVPSCPFRPCNILPFHLPT